MELPFSAKLSMYCSKINFHYQSQKIASMSCKATETQPQNFYKLLSLSSNSAKIDEIKKSYRNMALKYHPDVCYSSKKEESEKIFVQLNEAYKVLSEPISREEYDVGLDLNECIPNTRINKVDDQFARNRWEGQLCELKRQGRYHEKRKEGSWGRRMRAQSGTI